MDKERQKIRFGESVRILGRALRISVKVKSKASLILSFLGFPFAFLPVLISLTLSNFSNMVQALYGKGLGDFSQTLGIFLLLSCLYLVQLVFNSLRAYLAQNDSQRTVHFIKERILRCTCDVEYKYIENYDGFRDKIRFVNDQAGGRVAESMQLVLTWLQSVITFISLLIALAGVNIWVVIVLMMATIPSVILAYIQKDEEYGYKAKWSYESHMFAEYYFQATLPVSMNEVRFFGLYPYLRDKARAIVRIHCANKNKFTAKHVKYNSIADLLRNGVYLFILLITAAQIFENPTLGIGAFMLVFTMAGQLQEVSAKIFISAVQFMSDAAYMKDFFDLDALHYEERRGDAKPSAQYEIAFEGVNFTYPETEREVLHDLNIRIKPGEKVAIVGENGSGKSTFVSLLCAMYKPNTGKITLGGQDVFENLSQTRRTISAVFQDFARYEATLRENITISAPRKPSDDGVIRGLAQRTGAWDFIAEQENGLDEVVGVFSETGNNLSGGQWQKIALTRCAYRDDANIMVLDEPTAALDPLAEAELYRNFAALTGERTTILISHRLGLGITSLVDRILVFDDGRIVEDGDHRKLMEIDGLYARMYRAQAQWYQ